MSRPVIEPDHQIKRRARADTRLAHGSAPQTARASGAAVLGVLHDLALSPATAADALALLHELQVHQVELDMQDEELRASRAEIEAALKRQIQLYDFAPAGCCTLDRGGVLVELNLTAARLLGAERGALLGRALSSLLAPASTDALHALLAGAARGDTGCELQLSLPGGGRRAVRATVAADPAGPGFLLAFIESGSRKQAPAA
jgi:PAS domain-containing protein